MTTEQKQINISISKILNWPLSTEKIIQFTMAFFTKSSGSQILSKSDIGKYSNLDQIMNINSPFKIKYTQDDHLVILRISYQMGQVEKIVFGDFKIDLELLNKNKLLKFPVKSQVLIIEEFKIQKNDIQRIKVSNLKNTDDLSYPLNQDFIRQKQQFLQRYTNQSNSNSRCSSSNNLFTNQISEILFELKHMRNSQNLSQNQHNIQNFQQKSRFYHEKIRLSNFSSQKSLCYSNSNFSQQKISTNSRKNSVSTLSQKYVLYLNNLNIVPSQEYYDTKIKQITRNINHYKNNDRFVRQNQKQKLMNNNDYQ